MTNETGYLRHSPYIPYDPNAFTFVQSEGGLITPKGTGGLHPFEYEGWAKECLSWHDTCYIHAGLNPVNTYKLKGPDAIKLLSDCSVNGFKTFDVGKSRHVITCNEEGKIIIHGLALRVAEDEIITYWLWPYVQFVLDSGNYDCVGENLTGKVFNYQLGGPKTLEVLEAASGVDLHDIEFLKYKNILIEGREVMIYRVGMAGTLAYEVHGKIEDALVVYDKILKAGEEYGICRLGRKSYRVVHTEGGFPQVNYHFSFAGRAGMFEHFMGLDLCDLAPASYTGSMPADHPLQFRTPYDVGWGKMVNFNHEFVGKEALLKAKEEDKYRCVALEWDDEDVLNVYRAQFNPELNVTNMDWAEDYTSMLGSKEYHCDALLDEAGNIIGISSGRMYSPHYHKMISIATIETKYAELGNKVDLLWGNPGTDQLKIKVTIARHPYIDKNRNEDVDTSTIPSGIK